MSKLISVFAILSLLPGCVSLGSGTTGGQAGGYASRSGGRHVEVGLASWYGKAFHGRQMADGGTYDMYALVAAHKKLPLGSRVRVTNLSNGRSVIVTIRDRGPYVEGRIIDMSNRAAKMIGMRAKGVTKVRLEVLR